MIGMVAFTGSAGAAGAGAAVTIGYLVYAGVVCAAFHRARPPLLEGEEPVSVSRTSAPAQPHPTAEIRR